MSKEQITESDVNVSFNNTTGAFTLSAMQDGQRIKHTFFSFGHDEAIEAFLNMTNN